MIVELFRYNLVRCAAHLRMLCEHALSAYEKFGQYSDGIVRRHSESEASYSGQQRGLLVDYEALHEKLGYKTLKKEFYRDPFSKDYDYIVYLAEKITL